MKKTAALLFVLICFVAILPIGKAEEADAEEAAGWVYTIGSEENSLDGVYRRLCINMDLHSYPLPEPDAIRNRGTYSFGEYEKTVILVNTDRAYELVGTVYSKDNSEKYLIHRWIGYQEDGDIIGMDVYYSLHGKYIGNIRHNYTEGTSLPSHRCPYSIPGEELMK